MIADVPVRVYGPKQIPGDATKLAGVVFLHGGGWIFGSIGKRVKYNKIIFWFMFLGMDCQKTPRNILKAAISDRAFINSRWFTGSNNDIHKCLQVSTLLVLNFAGL